MRTTRFSALLIRGFASIFSTTENRYNAVDPDKLLELVAEKKERLEEILPELRRKFKERLAPEEAYIYRGLEGQKNIWREMLRVGKDVYIIGAKAQWFDPRIAAYRIAFFKEVNRKKIKFHLLIDHELRVQMPEFLKIYPVEQKEGRFLPKEHSTNSVIIVFGDYLVTYTGVRVGKFDDDVVFFVIRSKDLAESYRSWFSYMWGQSSGGSRR